MTVRVEFFGIPRQRAGTPRAEILGRTLGEVLRGTAEQFPALRGECLEDGRLRPGYLANLNGRQFVTDPDTPLADGDCILILSADAGG